MCMAKACGATRLVIYNDSNLIVQQTMKDCEAVADNMSAYQKLYNILEREFDGCELNYITRANNTKADELANIGSTRGPIPLGVFLESISQRSIKVPAAAPEAVVDGEDATDPAQVASASPSEGTNTSTPDSTAQTELEGPAWAKPNTTTRHGRSTTHQSVIQGVFGDQQTVVQAQHCADTPKMHRGRGRQISTTR